MTADLWTMEIIDVQVIFEGFTEIQIAATDQLFVGTTTKSEIIQILQLHSPKYGDLQVMFN